MVLYIYFIKATLIKGAIVNTTNKSIGSFNSVNETQDTRY